MKIHPMFDSAKYARSIILVTGIGGSDMLCHALHFVSFFLFLNKNSTLINSKFEIIPLFRTMEVWSPCCKA